MASCNALHAATFSYGSHVVVLSTCPSQCTHPSIPRHTFSNVKRSWLAKGVGRPYVAGTKQMWISGWVVFLACTRPTAACAAAHRMRGPSFHHPAIDSTPSAPMRTPHMLHGQSHTLLQAPTNHEHTSHTELYAVLAAWYTSTGHAHDACHGNHATLAALPFEKLQPMVADQSAGLHTNEISRAACSIAASSRSLSPVTAHPAHARIYLQHIHNLHNLWRQHGTSTTAGPASSIHERVAATHSPLHDVTSCRHNARSNARHCTLYTPGSHDTTHTRQPVLLGSFPGPYAQCAWGTHALYWLRCTSSQPSIARRRTWPAAQPRGWLGQPCATPHLRRQQRRRARRGWPTAPHTRRRRSFSRISPAATTTWPATVPPQAATAPCP